MHLAQAEYPEELDQNPGLSHCKYMNFTLCCSEHKADETIKLQVTNKHSVKM